MPFQKNFNRSSMHIENLNGKSVCILGYGREGQAMVKAIEEFAPEAKLTIADQNEKIEIEGKYGQQLGMGWLENLEKFDVIIKSPGIPPQPQFKAVQPKITSSTQIFLDTIADSKALTIGITGSKGKSTTTALLYQILKTDDKDAHLVGNIGEPAIAHIKDAKKNAIFVMEMSSYQLMDLNVSPNIAVITSFFPEHLDYHGSLAAYKEAKSHITKFQNKEDVVFYNNSSENAYDLARISAGKQIPFFANEAPVALKETRLIGNHNLGNIAAAAAVAKHLGVPEAIIIATAKSFKGLPHRLQSLGVHHNIEWVDDAISTTPESTMAALEALNDRVAIIILGGQDRGNNFSELGRRIAESEIEHVILFPGSGPRIRKAIEDADAEVEFHEVDSIEDAVSIAKRMPLDMKQPICLLSTASPSYGMFKNFEEKGSSFAKLII